MMMLILLACMTLSSLCYLSLPNLQERKKKLKIKVLVTFSVLSYNIISPSHINFMGNRGLRGQCGFRR